MRAMHVGISKLKKYFLPKKGLPQETFYFPECPEISCCFDVHGQLFLDYLAKYPCSGLKHYICWWIRVLLKELSWNFVTGNTGNRRILMQFGVPCWWHDMHELCALDQLIVDTQTYDGFTHTKEYIWAHISGSINLG